VLFLHKKSNKNQCLNNVTQQTTANITTVRTADIMTDSIITMKNAYHSDRILWIVDREEQNIWGLFLEATRHRSVKQTTHDNTQTTNCKCKVTNLQWHRI